MIARHCCFYSVLLFVLNSLIAQTNFSISDDLDHTWQVGKDLGKAIVQPETEDVKFFLISSAAVFTSMWLIDKPLDEYAGDHKDSFKDKLFKIDRIYGDSRYMIGGSLALYGSGYIFQDKHLKNMGLRVCQAYMYTGLITVAVKELFGRARPYTDQGVFSFHPFSFEEKYRSFFSGHTSGTFAFSTVMACEYDYWWWKTIWYSAAVLVGGARIYHHRHWFSDVIAGALVGYAIGRFVATYEYPENASSPTVQSGNQQQDMLFNFTIPLN